MNMKQVDIKHLTQLDDEDRKATGEVKEQIDRKLAVLKNLKPFILDMAPREGSLPASYGHTLDDKHELLSLSKEFGFKDISITGYFDYVNVDQVFAQQLRESGDSMDGYFSNLMPAKTEAGKPFKPSYSQRQFKSVGTPNCLLLIYLEPEALTAKGRTYDDLFRDIVRNVEYLREILPEPSARRGRIFIRIVDIFDAWDQDPELLTQVLKLLQQLPIQAVIFEDVRGTHFPFQNAEMVRLIRKYVEPPRLVLVHSHSGNGMEDAAAIDAILAGADGIWAGLSPHAAQGAHSSGAMLICNLLRAGNEQVNETYDLTKLYPIVERMSVLHMGEPLHEDYPVFGRRSFHYIDEAFVQSDRPQDLNPESIGHTSGWRITPALAMPAVIRNRMKELGYGKDVYDDKQLVKQVKILMSEANISGRRILADDPEVLNSLVGEARQRLRRGATEAAGYEAGLSAVGEN